MRPAFAGRQCRRWFRSCAAERRAPAPHSLSCRVAGSSSARVAPAVSLPPEDANRVTGEEEERSVYTGEALCAAHRLQLSVQR